MAAKDASTWVGVAGFEPAASSSRTKDGEQAGGPDNSVTSGSMSQDTTSHPNEIPAPDASVTHAPGTAYADATSVILDAAEDIGVFAGLWAARDDSKPDAAARRAANDAMAAIDRMLLAVHVLRERLVGDIRVSDDAAAVRADAVLAAGRTGATA